MQDALLTYGRPLSKSAVVLSGPGCRASAERAFCPDSCGSLGQHRAQDNVTTPPDLAILDNRRTRLQARIWLPADLQSKPPSAPEIRFAGNLLDLEGRGETLLVRICCDFDFTDAGEVARPLPRLCVPQDT